MSSKTVERNRLRLIRDAARIYFGERGGDKRDPHIAEQRREVAMDIRYFHNKWLKADTDGRI